MRELYWGDCLELHHKIPNGSISAIILDLPFGITKCGWDTPLPMDRLWPQITPLIKDNGVIIMFGCQPFTSALVMSNPQMFKYSLVYQKTTPSGYLNANKMPLRCHEDILVFYKKQPTYHPQKTTGHKRKISTAEHKRNSKKTENYNPHNITGYDSTERYPTSVLLFSTDRQKSKLHPTQKPVALIEYLIRTYTNEGDTILDSCMGAGTTGVACINTGRRFVGIEKERKYYDIAHGRMLELDGRF